MSENPNTNTDEQSASIVAELVMRVTAVVYALSFALGGHLLWKPVYEQYFKYEPGKGASAIDQVLAGMSGAMEMFGVFGGVILAAIVAGLLIRRQGGGA